MNTDYDIAVIGAGPAGMAAAIEASGHGAKVLVLDEQAAPGGQIYRAVERNAGSDRSELGESYAAGLPLAKGLRDSGAEWLGGATVWQVTGGADAAEIGYSHGGEARIVTARRVIIATGALERPVPVPGWTKAGVMTIGAAQILLKENGLAAGNAVFAGTGPLFYLVLRQYLAVGVPVAGAVDLTPAGNYLSAARHLPASLPRLSAIAEGWQWKREIRRAGVRLVSGIDDLRVTGDGTATGISFRHKGSKREIAADHVLLHLGVVPNVNLALAAGCEAQWEPTLPGWTIRVDDWFVSSQPTVIVAGDGAAIGGAEAARHAGALAGLGALAQLGLIDSAARDRAAAPHRHALQAERRLRAFLDTLFRPAARIRIPQDDDTVVCRCEEVTVKTVREVLAVGCTGPNQLKSFSRCGMGPCQGRFCGLTVSELIAEIRQIPVEDAGYFRLRPPVKPLALAELAGLASDRPAE